MKSKFLVSLFGIVVGLIAAGILPARAEQVCQVTDPTGTPLNVRDSPNGQVINALNNGGEIYINDTAYDEQGRAWVKVGSYYQGEYRIWGWVIREFISCYNR